MSPELRDALAEMGRADRLLVALDFDGTISPIVAVPSAARPVPGALEVMAQLASAPGTEVVLLSGRARQDLASVSGAGEWATLIGSHGQEVGADLTLTEDESTLLAEVRAGVRAAVAGVPGVRVEHKPAGLAIHVRGCTDTDAERALDLVRGLADEMAGTFCLEGKLVIELSTRPLDKGSALRALIEADPARLVLFAGDDITDESAMAVLRPDAVAIRVGEGESLARYRVPDPQSMLEALATLATIRAQHHPHPATDPPLRVRPATPDGRV
jgi:trehalose 6-phosphate phosphatase